jgi:hypothetical protein
LCAKKAVLPLAAKMPLNDKLYPILIGFSLMSILFICVKGDNIKKAKSFLF